MHPLLTRVANSRARATARGRWRARRIRDGAQAPCVSYHGRELLNFASNDYLGLANHPRVIERVRRELTPSGFGSGAAALLSGYSAVHAELERAIAAETRHEAGLLFSSGYLANLGALSALVSRHDLIVHDRLNHASLLDAVVLSRAKHRRYRHADPADAEHQLRSGNASHCFLVSETIFSMDGDAAPVDALHRLAQESQATLYLDDAHGFLVAPTPPIPLSPRDPAPNITMVTLGKALGSVGAVVCAPAAIIEYLVQRARTFIYDTALPPVCAAAALEALALYRDDPAIRTALHDNILLFKHLVTDSGLPMTTSAGPIQPLIVGSDSRALELAATLHDAGFYVPAIRPPTVPENTARLRITLSAAHTAAQIEALVSILATALERHPA